MLTDFPGQDGPLLLAQPKEILTTSNPEEIPELLQQAELLAKAGGWIGGFLSYEAAAAFALPVVKETTWPRLWFARFAHAQPVVFPHPAMLGDLDNCSAKLQISQTRYRRDLDKILGYIRAGDSYQVNHTLTANLEHKIDLATLFLRLQPQHRFPYAAWLNTGEGLIASFSPELLLHRQDNSLVSAPIKGTRPRSADQEEDWAVGEELQHSKKDRAEHVMIVDMARNDLGRVCSVGSIQVPHLFEHRCFSTVHHLESRVQGELLPGLGLDAVMAAMFPAASITGAPKRRTMEIIQEMEGRERGVYTGSIGVIRPGGDCTFNVAIRTVTQNRLAGENCLGLGGGIIADSDPGQEWIEIADKGAFLSKIPEPFGLIETFLLDKNGDIDNLAAHLSRLGRSARRLGFNCDLIAIKSRVAAEVATLAEEKLLPRILRLELALDGRVAFSHRPFVTPPATLKIMLAPNRLDRLDPLLQHKTTRRANFDHGFQSAKKAGYDDVLFLNNLGMVTEGAIRAILCSFAGRWYAPPVVDGLLPSIWRAKQIAQRQAQEKSLTLDDLSKADEIIMGNAVQGGRSVAELWSGSNKII
jgi:para-aminobenzoate synthetase / 4-amino-4-deoxychorismate lyase